MRPTSRRRRAPMSHCATHGSQQRPAKMACCNHGSGHHSSTALTAYAYAAVHATVIKDKQRLSVENCKQTNIEKSENESEFECFIRSWNFRTSFNIPNAHPPNTWFLGSSQGQIPNDMSIGSECPYTLQGATPFPPQKCSFP